MAADKGIQPREVNVWDVQKILREQGAHLSDDDAVRAAGQAAAAE